MNQNGGIHKGGFAVLCHRNGGSESPGILIQKAAIILAGIDYGAFTGMRHNGTARTKSRLKLNFKIRI